MHVVTLLTGRGPLALAFVFTLLAVSLASADTITLAWDANAGTVSGYAVYLGTQRIDVGNTTTYAMTNAVAGQRYCFAVAAYNSAGEGPKTSQVCGYSNEFPTLTNPGNQSSKVGQAVSLQLNGADPDGLPISYTATGLPPGLFIGSATGFISGTLSTAGTYSVTARVYDGVLQSSAQSFTWTVTANTTADTTNPSIAIASPTTAASYTASGATMSISGTASDNVGVSSVSWINSRGGGGTASGTTTWAASSIGLQIGTNVITVTARDVAGNVGTDVLTVTYSSSDSTAPTVTIGSPTAASTYSTTSASVTVSGTASDNLGVTQVSWATDRGAAGTASGTTTWTAGIPLQSGANVVTVTARDAAGNRTTDVLTVTYSTGDTTPPSITIVGPTSSSTYSTTSSVVTLGGTSSDNRGVTAVTWTNDRGGSGFSSGTTSWSIPSIPLQGGTNVIRVTAQDAAGNTGTDTLTVNYSAPTTSLRLTGQSYRSGNGRKVQLQWSGATTPAVEIHFQGRLLRRTKNDGSETDSPRGTGPYTYKVCQPETTICSNSITVN